MIYEKFWDDLIRSAKLDPEYQRHLETAKKAETDYLAVCKRLIPAQRMILEDYISACEEQCDCMTVLAYRLGKGEK